MASHLMIQVEAYIKFLVNVAKQCTLWERALKIRFRLDLWLSCLLTSDFYRWLWIRSYSFVKKGRENFLYKTETNSFHFFHFDKVESLSLFTLYNNTVFDFGNFGSHDEILIVRLWIGNKTLYRESSILISTIFGIWKKLC